MKRQTFATISLLALFACDAGKPGDAGAPPLKVVPFPKDVAEKFAGSYDKAVDWIVSKQDPSTGAWKQRMGDNEFQSVGLTALATHALASAPDRHKAKARAAIDKGVEFLLAHQDMKRNDDPAKNHYGAFSELPNPPGQLRAYLTSIAIMVLTTVDKDKHKERIGMAVEYLKHLQKTEGFYAGGTGYGEVELKPDGVKVSDAPNMSTTAWAAEAMSSAGVPTDEEYWKRVADFVGRMQQNAESNVDPTWINYLKERGYTIGNDGSVIYSPKVEDAGKYAGVVENPDGTKSVIGYGSMTYAGIKTYLYAGLKKDDPKVRAAIEWARKNYTLDYHPGFPYEADLPAAKRKANQGIYYYYLMMAKALDAYGENPFVDDKGVKHDWSLEIAQKLMALQAADGTWVNPNPRWWEEQPALVTPYVLSIYSILSKRIQ